MLLRFAVKNFRSISEEQELLFTATRLSGDEEIHLLSNAAIPRHSVLPAIVIYGLNASGKTNILSALSRMSAMVVNSHKAGDHSTTFSFRPFLLDEEFFEAPTYFELDFVQDNERFTYSFSFDRNLIVSEHLTVTQGSGTSLLFDRNEKNEFTFGRKLKGQINAIKELTRPNSLFLSAGAQNNHPLLTKISDFFRRVDMEGSAAPNAENTQIRIHSEHKNAISNSVISFLSDVGTGVVDYEIQKNEVTEEEELKRSAFMKSMQVALSAMVGQDVGTMDIQPIEETVRLGHRGREVSPVYFELNIESSGTRRMLTMLPAVFSVLESGGCLLLDEIDASLHRRAAELILALFSRVETNPNGAQIVTTTHNTGLLESKFLRRDQVWFTEKTISGSTKLYPLSDFKVRKSDSMERGYLQGRFGAMPRTHITSFINKRIGME